ncbi:MAG: type II secretion system F family protein [Planctomycetota bacterium]|nr:MAG: type II secretion system F family protein [Planctomycetota bacterium]
MPTFTCEAVDGKGNKVKKEVDAEDRDEAMVKLKGMGLYPTKVEEAAGRGAAAVAGGGGERRAGRTFTIGGVSLGALTTFTQQLATLQDAGLPIVRSLRILEGQLKPGVLKNALLDVAEDVESGATLSEAMAKHPKCFDRLYVGMIKAGEAGGVLDTILDRLANFMEKSLKLKKKVIGALIYPIVVTVVAVGILAGIMKFVIPAFKKMFEETGITLPALTEMLIEVSNFVSDYWFLLPGIPIVGLLILKGLKSHPRSKYMIDKFTLHMPVFGTIIHKSTISRFSRTLGTLIASGVPILESLSITREATTNDVIAKAIDDVHASIREGESIARPLQEAGVFDDMMVNMVDIGEETGELDKMLNKIADNYDDDVDVAVESLSSIIEPILIVGMGGAVGFIVIALFLPLIQLIEKL